MNISGSPLFPYTVFREEILILSSVSHIAAFNEIEPVSSASHTNNLENFNFAIHVIVDTQFMFYIR